MLKALIFILWLDVYVWSVGATLANCRHFLDDPRNKSINERIKEETEKYRKDLAFSVGINLLPPSLIVCPFITGFYEHGWAIKPPSSKDWEKKQYGYN